MKIGSSEHPTLTYRKQRALNRVQLALLTGIPYNTLCAIERGLVGEVSRKTALTLAAVLGCHPATVRAQYSRWRRKHIEGEQL